MSDVAGEQVPGATTVGGKRTLEDLVAESNAQGLNSARNQDVVIAIRAPIDFPYHRWLAFSSAVQAEVVKLMKRHGLIEDDDGNGR